MKSLQLYKEVEIFVEEIPARESDPHKHSFFELIYVLEGSGYHIINQNSYNFSKGDVFLLTPDDSHTFKVETPTKFCVIDFTKTFFSKDQRNEGDKADVSDFFMRLEYIFHNHHTLKGSIIKPGERTLFKTLISQLMKEISHARPFANIIQQNIVFLLLHFIARTIQSTLTQSASEGGTKSIVHAVTSYIQQNIYDPESIRLDTIAAHFNKTGDHLSRYFKQQTGSSLKTYITRYKVDLIKTRLKFSDLTISEIAHELHFTDESHLNKTFKKLTGMTAKEFKKANKNEQIKKKLQELPQAH